MGLRSGLDPTFLEADLMEGSKLSSFEPSFELLNGRYIVKLRKKSSSCGTRVRVRVGVRVRH